MAYSGWEATRWQFQHSVHGTFVVLHEPSQDDPRLRWSAQRMRSVVNTSDTGSDLRPVWLGLHPSAHAAKLACRAWIRGDAK